MSTQRYTSEFKEDAVRQVVERGTVPEVAARLGAAHSLYKQVKAVMPTKDDKALSTVAMTGGAFARPTILSQA